MRRGWCRGYFCVDADGRPSHYPDSGGPTHFSLVGAIRTAGEGRLVAEYALRTLRRLTSQHNLVDWNDHPLRTKADVLALLDRAIAEHGGHVPRGRGGWVISARPTSNSQPRSNAMKRSPKKSCLHTRTRLPARVGKRILALCCACERLVVVAREAKRA